MGFTGLLLLCGVDRRVATIEMHKLLKLNKSTRAHLVKDQEAGRDSRTRREES